MARRARHYTGDYDRRRADMVARANADPSTRCAMPGCGKTLAEHPPTKSGRRPIWTVDHARPGDPLSPLRLAASSCNYAAGARLANERRRRLRTTVDWSAPEAPARTAGDRDVVLIVGPPGGGKSTKAAELTRLGYVHLEREMFPSDGQFRAAAVAASRRKNARVAVVRCCFDPNERAEWANLLGTTRVLVCDPGESEAKRRVAARRRPTWRGEIKSVSRWYRPDQAHGPARLRTTITW